ncbi:MAG: aminotransferase class I/II-fold pyridoxal phosphate-dependent enzyme [Muribaculaceae bacterium]
MEDRIFLSFPHLGGHEMRYINEAFEGSWVVPLGPHVDEFEKRLEHYLHAPNVVALSAGTAALHLGLVMLGVGAGDEVLCQSFTFAASANPVRYQGASPVFVDSEPTTWNMSPEALEEAIVDRKKVTGRYPKAIVVVHLYGMPAMMDEILSVAGRYGIPVLEDAAEALGSEYHGTMCGTLGDYGALSFNGNKIITTSGGGALICPDATAAGHVKFLATQAREPMPYYFHKELGFNYRLSNISAGIGCGQMEFIADRVARRRAIHELYAEGFKNLDGISVHNNPADDVKSNFWLTTILFDEHSGISPEDARLALEAENIESRWLWRPMNMQPIYADAPYYGGKCAEGIFGRGLCLPSGSILTDGDVERVIDCVTRFIKHRL